MSTPKILLTAAILILQWETTAAQLSIPSRSLGFLYGGSGQRPEVQIVAYLDPTCPDSKAVYPTLIKVADYYTSDQLQFRMHLHNLPYHRNSHVISKATHVLDKYAPNKNTSFKWIDLVYSNLDNLTTSATAMLNDAQVLQILSGLARGLTGIQETDFTSKVADPAIDGLTRLDFKYGCTRGVHSTPMFTINDIFVDATNWNFNAWKAAIDKLLNA
ncbi:hypothetical protein RRG08_043594 [Elysia crispata]|uniref:Thioredoxin-like fold domain-containing protein n=1 Tax=Elysia crispata TaxID=231223 RepID=A0AAE1A5L0_9GAST|nr:hypothetical protein RRG08_043594 [Elysia crispata]